MKILIIIALWLMWFFTIGCFHYLFDGNYFWYRTILIIPFTIAALKITLIINEYYKTK